MNATLKLYNSVREAFPEITAKADREHIKQWGSLGSEVAYSWFESLANAVNGEMLAGVNPEVHDGLMAFICGHLPTNDEELHACIDVSFVENLFWRVPGGKAEPYWNMLPQAFKELYVGFHRRTPL